MPDWVLAYPGQYTRAEVEEALRRSMEDLIKKLLDEEFRNADGDRRVNG